MKNLHDKEKHVICIRNLKQILNHGFILEKVQSHWVIKFYQKTWLKPYIDMKKQAKRKAKINFKKDCLKLIYNNFFPKPW